MVDVTHKLHAGKIKKLNVNMKLKDDNPKTMNCLTENSHLPQVHILIITHPFSSFLFPQKLILSYFQTFA